MKNLNMLIGYDIEVGKKYIFVDVLDKNSLIQFSIRTCITNTGDYLVFQHDNATFNITYTTEEFDDAQYFKAHHHMIPTFEYSDTLSVEEIIRKLQNDKNN